MVAPYTASFPEPGPILTVIPSPDLIQRRLYEVVTEAILLRRLLRISRDKQKAFNQSNAQEAKDVVP